MKPTIYHSLAEFIRSISLKDNKRISFHHHLRNGDGVINRVLSYYHKNNIKHLELYPSAIFSSYTMINELLKQDNIDHITTNYINGDVASYISNHVNKNILTMQTHGGRARAIEEGKSIIDIAFIAAPSVDFKGNAIGYKGPSKFGSMGYAVPDSLYAKKVVLITDNLVESTIEHPEINGENVDAIVKVDSLGDRNKIVSGTTAITTHPIGVKIASLTARFLKEANIIKEGFSFQTGAGGTSLKVTDEIRHIMKQEHITASFCSGGITQYHVNMLEEGLVKKLYDVQCFDLKAIDSLEQNDNHIPISASLYANPINENRIIKDLDLVILGATEIDLNFNVNVTTSSHHELMGGSGGHSDTASEAACTIIVSPLLQGRIPVISDRVQTITTKGEYVDVFITERGIVIHPNRRDLLALLQESSLPIYTMKEMMDIAHSYTSIPKKLFLCDIIIGEIEDRTYEILDEIHSLKER